MHETVIVKDIIEQINKKAEGKRVKSVTLEVGDLAHLPAQELKAFLTNMVKYKVIVNPVKARVKCRCGYTGKPRILVHEHDLVLFECPKCSKTPQILGGEEIVLKEILTE